MGEKKGNGKDRGGGGGEKKQNKLLNVLGKNLVKKKKKLKKKEAKESLKNKLKEKKNEEKEEEIDDEVGFQLTSSMKVKAKKPSHKSESNKDEEDNVEESKIKEKSQKLKALAASLALKSRKNGHESTNKTKKHQERSINSSFIEDHSDDDDDDEKLTTSEKKDKSSSTNVDDPRTFADLGLVDSLVDATKALGWKKPSAIQKQAIPQALEGKDIIGLAQTGSGKTGAFALPILQDLLENPSPFFACVLSPTRELAVQISEQFEALGASMGVRCAVVVGGIDMISQSIALAKRPHIIIGTPGRLVDHLENTKGFNLRSLKYLVLDEADRLLTLDFGDEIEKILAAIPRKRSTYLFSATMTTRVAKLQRASLTNPVKVEVSTKYSTVDTLIQQYLFLPAKHKDVYLAYALNELTGSTIMVFTSTCNTTLRLTIMLRNLGFSCVPLHGQMTQPKRLGALTKFKSGQRNILIATDVASRGLDIPLVDCVINFDIPAHSKDYIHRVGRTARAGRSGRAITFVSQYDIELYQRIETLIGKKLPAFDAPQEEVMLLLERVLEAQRFAAMEVKERADSKKNNKRKRGGGGYEDGGGGGGGKRRK